MINPMLKHKSQATSYPRFPARQNGVTLVELMVAMAIGSFLILGAFSAYSQSRGAYVINESLARVQETAQFAMDSMESDLRMASFWGLNSRGELIEGRSIPGDDNPLALPVPGDCGSTWVLDLDRPIAGENNDFTLDCEASGGKQLNSDSLTVRRASAETALPEAGRVQIQSTRIQGQLFTDGTRPAAFDAVSSQTHDLLVNTYYVAADSTLVPGVPTLRKKTLVSVAGAPELNDLEVAPGVENMQVMFGVDVNEDNTVDRYVNPGDDIFDPAAAEFLPDARVISARIWLLIRSIDPETGIEDNRDYEPGDVDLGVYNDSYRRLLVSKTILLRNSRS